LLANNQITFDLLEYYYEEGAAYVGYYGIEVGDMDQRRIVSTLSVYLLAFTGILYERYR
jgi:hypothetical protein